MAIQRIGIIGCGKISGIYLKNLTGMFGSRVKVTAVTDLIEERAEKASVEYNVRHIKKTIDLIKDPEVDIILNLTQPLHHYDVTLQAVKNGKHIYNEKPFCVKREEAKKNPFDCKKERSFHRRSSRHIYGPWDSNLPKDN